MYKIPEKFTGYNAEKVGTETFKSLCYSLQGLGIVKVLEIDGYEYPKNYYSALVEDFDGQFHIFMNCFTSVFCFVHISDEKQEYLTRGELEHAIKELYPASVILSESILSKNITEEYKENLQPLELKALNYWLPCTVGRAMFSWFFD